MNDEDTIEKKCLFCEESFYKDRTIKENKYWYAVCDGYPVSSWHTLIIPKRHVNSFFNLNIFELFTLFPFLKKVKKEIDSVCEPHAYNLGINDGSAAGQTIPHLHLHLIPRKNNDGGLPCGVRNVFPKEIANYKKVLAN